MAGFAAGGRGDGMASVGDELTRLFSRLSRAEQRPLSAGEHLGEDGLIYCDACNTPRQCSVPNSLVQGEHLRCPISCLCERQVIEAEMAADQRREDMRRISELRGASLMTDRLRAAVFQGWTPQDETYQTCKRYAEQFEAMLAANQGLLFYGPSGTGKTFAAACIANALLERGVPVLMTSMVRLMAVLDGKGDEEGRILAAMNRAKLVVIDDLGAERDTSYGLEKAYAFIDARYRESKPLVITTNLDMAEMQRETRVGYQRIYDRVLECCYPMLFEGQSRRKQEARRRYEKMQKLLFDDKGEREHEQI